MLHKQHFYYTVFQRLFTLIQKYQLHKCSKTLFTQNSYHICIANPLAGFFKVQVFTEGYFGKDWLMIKSDNWQIVCFFSCCLNNHEPLSLMTRKLMTRLQLLRQLLKYDNNHCWLKLFSVSYYILVLKH